MQCINSVDRALLNKNLLDEVERIPGVTVYFEHKLLRANFDADEVVFSTNDETRTVKAALVVGCDGAFSKVREQMMRVCRCAHHLRLFFK
jgi:kynurenine 3-monooxygenase